MAATYKDLTALFRSIAESAITDLEYGKGTLEEMNSGSKNYPLCWWVLPMEVTESATDATTARQEAWPIVIRFVDSGKISSEVDAVDTIYSTTKALADGFIQKLLEQDYELGNIVKRQLFKVQDDVHIGWEYRFNLTVWPDIDYCCGLYEQ